MKRVKIVAIAFRVVIFPAFLPSTLYRVIYSFTPFRGLHNAPCTILHALSILYFITSPG
jgi:hypothetical protein